MQTTSGAGRASTRFAVITFVIVSAAGCGIEKQSAPALAGPSEFSTSIQMTASPDTLARDGVSQSIITLTARDAANSPVPGLALTMFTNTGALSADQVTTGSNGVATLTFTAPSLQEPVETATIRALPVGTNIDNSRSRNVSIALLAPAAAVPTFTVSPESPLAFQLTTFDASGTTLGGQSCGDACTYEWAFGAEATATGQIVTYRFQQESVYIVRLTVTSPGSIRTTTQRTVTVGASVSPTAAFTFSPTNPQPGDTVLFNASSSTGANGATIVSYAWDFGNSGSATGVAASTTFSQERTFLVRLTVTDDRGQTATVTQTVTVTF